MDLNSLLIFEKVAESGTFTAAALALKVPKSLVSQKIARLEDDLGLRLLHRTTRRVSLTEEGRRILEMVTDVVEHVEEIEAFASDSGGKPTGLLRVSAAHDFGIFLIREVIADFLNNNPDVQVEINLDNRYVDLVEEGFDMALRATSTTLRDSSLVATKLADTAMRLFCSNSYFVKGNMPTKVEDLSAHPIVTFARQGRGIKPTLDLSREKRSVSIPVSSVFMTNDMLALKHAVLSGLGIGLLPEFLVIPELVSREIVTILPDWGAPHASFYAVHPSRRHLPPKVRAFTEFLKSRLSPGWTAT